MEELKQLLLEVSDSYFDFVIGVMAEARDCPEHLNDLIQFIKDNPQATSSDIGRWTMINLEGLDPDNPVSIVVDDDELEEDEYSEFESQLKAMERISQNFDVSVWEVRGDE